MASPRPIRILQVFDTYESLKRNFLACEQHVRAWHPTAKIRLADHVIESQEGSQVFFRLVSDRSDISKLQGFEVHHVWIDESHRYGDDLARVLACRARLK